jgi:hypothetical protein
VCTWDPPLRHVTRTIVARPVRRCVVGQDQRRPVSLPGAPKEHALGITPYLVGITPYFGGLYPGTQEYYPIIT